MTRLVLLSCFAFVACGPVDTYVVDVPSDGGVELPGMGCARTEDCMGGQFCEKTSCGDALGTCRQRPVFCPGDGPPECGCDGVTYWNRCLRQNAGISATREMGPCRSPKACDTTTPCDNGGYCARLVFPNQCGGLVAGACWVLPDVACEGPAPSFFSCSGGNTTCFNACAAIRSELPMAERPRTAGPCP